MFYSLIGYALTYRDDGLADLVLEQRHVSTLYRLDIDQAEVLGKALIEMVAGVREQEQACG